MITKEQLATCFQDTMKMAYEGSIYEDTQKSIAETRIYYEDFSSDIKPQYEPCEVFVEANTSFAEAQKHVVDGRVAVLNFANPHNPGGGVQFGAMAQEECLCRSSNLYPCLVKAEIIKDFYEYHKSLGGMFFSDRLIYSPNVLVYKNDQAVPEALPEHQRFHVDIITCAAPYLGAVKYMNPTVLRNIYTRRIKNIFEAALDNQVETIILGALGCGAFKNPPELVAKAFKSVIDENHYTQKFKKIVFAIKKESEQDYGKNYRAFYAKLKHAFLVNCPSFELPPLVFPTGRELKPCQFILSGHYPMDISREEVVNLVLQEHNVVKDSLNQELLKMHQKFYQFQRGSVFYKKQISILGDSISTLSGFQPAGYRVFFEGNNCARARVWEMEQTWWGQVIQTLGAELLANNSWSGSRVTRLPQSETLFPSGCSDERNFSLHVADVFPDVIIIYLGTNDWANAVKPELDQDSGMLDVSSAFLNAYEMMLTKLRKNYPNAAIYCCTLNETTMSQNLSFKFPFSVGGIHLNVYNDKIREAAEKHNCSLIDFAKYHVAYDSIDGSHPNLDGMKTLATMALREMLGKEADFLDCAHGLHNLMPWGENEKGSSICICRNCCKIIKSYKATSEEVGAKFDQGILVPDAKGNAEKYIFLQGDITTMLFSNILKVFDEQTQKMVEVEKDIVYVGRGKECDIVLGDDNEKMDQLHATFYYEPGKWFLEDHNSTNGTVLNGVKLQAGIKYQLNVGDKIIFAQDTKVVFYPSEALSSSNTNRPFIPLPQPSLQPVVTGLPLPPAKTKCRKRKHFIKKQGFAIPQPPMLVDLSIDIGKVIGGKYKVLKEIGTSRRGVYLAKELKSRKKVIIKCESQNAYIPFIPPIRKNYDIYKSIDHSGLQKLLEVVHEDGKTYGVWEYVVGKSLNQIKKKWKPKEVAQIAYEVAGILEYLHSLNPPVIYGDLKPSNIILGRKKSISLIDLETIKVISHSQQNVAYGIGTAGYAAIEQCRGQARPQSDIYSLGITMLRLLVPGAKPYSPNVFNHSELLGEIEPIVFRCIQSDYTKRYQTCDELRKVLETYLKEGKIEPYSDRNVIVPPIDEIVELVDISQIQPVQVSMNYSPEVIERIGMETDDAVKQRIEGNRYDTTGAVEYAFYEGEQKICSLSSLVLPPPQSYWCIYGPNISWKCIDDPEQTILPGLTKVITENETGAEASKITYFDSGKYCINDSIMVYENGTKYVYFIDDQIIAKMKRVHDNSGHKHEKPEFECTPWFEALLYREVDDKTRTMILAFPFIKMSL